VTMRFPEFEAHRARASADHPSWLDAGETNLYRALPQHFPELARLADPVLDGPVHRCHLASETLDFLGLSRARWEPRMGISLGVRDGLRILFEHAAEGGIEVLLPTDVYPAYWEIAAATAVKRRGWEARLPFGTGGFPPPAEDGAAQWLLTLDPVKPWGRDLAAEELTRIRAWAAGDARRRVLVDAVYSPRRLPASAEALIDEGIGVGLMSLSKGWLSPQKMGWALFSARDAAALRPRFLCQKKNAAGLSFARVAYRDHPARPAAVAAAVERLRSAFVEKVETASGVRVELPRLGYLVPDPGSAAAWEERGVIAIPASVFGSAWGGSFLSVIPPAETPLVPGARLRARPAPGTSAR
jgi:aspartate/methionine/tyrosine aminotransferase